MEHPSIQFCTVYCNHLKNTSHLFHIELNEYNFAAKDLFWKDFSWCKAWMLEFRISILSINKEISKLYDALIQKFILSFSLGGKWGGHACSFLSHLLVR